MFFGWEVPPEFGLAFDVALHIGTLAAIVAFFRAEIIAMVRSLPSALSLRRRALGARGAPHRDRHHSGRDRRDPVQRLHRGCASHSGRRRRRARVWRRGDDRGGAIRRAAEDGSRPAVDGCAADRMCAGISADPRHVAIRFDDRDGHVSRRAARCRRAIHVSPGDPGDGCRRREGSTGAEGDAAGTWIFRGDRQSA